MSSVAGYYRDLREHVKALKDEGLLYEITRLVNKDSELHPLVRLRVPRSAGGQTARVPVS